MIILIGCIFTYKLYFTFMNNKNNTHTTITTEKKDLMISHLCVLCRSAYFRESIKLALHLHQIVFLILVATLNLKWTLEPRLISCLLFQYLEIHLLFHPRTLILSGDQYLFLSTLIAYGIELCFPLFHVKTYILYL